MTVSNVSLNLDTAGSDLVGYAYNDAGSTWTFESVTVIKEGKPDVVLSTDEEKQLYIIRSAADPDDILMFDDDGIALMGLWERVHIATSMAQTILATAFRSKASIMAPVFITRILSSGTRRMAGRRIRASICIWSRTERRDRIAT